MVVHYLLEVLLAVHYKHLETKPIQISQNELSAILQFVWLTLKWV